MALPWASAVGFTLVPSVGAYLGSHHTRGEGLRWYDSLQKPAWHPPRWVLGPIWGTLYSTMGCSRGCEQRFTASFAKSRVEKAAGPALVDILLLGGMATATAVVWHQVSPAAARLLYPYLAWLAFGAALNYCIWRDNRGRRGGGRLVE
ncbi:hypothetical protein MC885_012514 [Smutsia gigantea]|nr:hypothetical protein MC885_012514 [Smutsia gigantea]